MSRCNDCDLTVNCLVSALWESQSVTHAGRILVYSTTTPNFLKLTARGLFIQQHNIKAVLTRLCLKRILDSLLNQRHVLCGHQTAGCVFCSFDNTCASNRCLIDVCFHLETVIFRAILLMCSMSQKHSLTDIKIMFKNVNVF